MSSERVAQIGGRRRARWLWAAVFFLALSLVAALVAWSAATEAATVDVDAGSNWFCDPSYEDGVCETQVTAGDTVVWEMVQGVHTVTECDDTFTVCPPDGGFDSGILGQGETFSHTFTQPGSYEYFCDLHANSMRGRVLVATAPTATPTPSPTPTEAPTPSPTPAPTPGYVATELLATGKSQAVGLAMLPGSEDDGVLITQTGDLWLIDLAQPSATPAPFGNVRDRMTRQGDEGLLGIAFEPGNPDEVYINYTRGTEYYRPYSTDPTRFPVTTMPPDPKRNRIARFDISGGVLDVNSEETIYESLRPGDWHTVNQIAFDDAGYLYAGSGDGGWIEAAFDSDAGQGVGNELATLIRIDPNEGAPGHTIPADNPFNDGAGPNKDEVYAYGLRNPWRISFDSLTGDLWGADVGQWNWEEVNRIQPGGNYGWKIMEGDECRTSGCSPPPGYIAPRTAYCNHFNSNPLCEYDDECAIIGGYVYRGTAIPELYGHYVYSDFCSGRIRAVDAYGTADPVLLVDTALSPVSFVEDPAGELLIVDYTGKVLRLDGDPDGDGRGSPVDNCPAWYNPAQSLPGWAVPAGDSDCDGFSDAREAYLETNPANQCAADTGPDNEPAPDAWPMDMNDDRRANTVDVGQYVFVLNTDTNDPEFAPRMDLTENGAINTIDVGRYVFVLNQLCSPGGT